MFASAYDVERLTGYIVENELIFMAQAIIETYVGRVESQVYDGVDEELLQRAVAYQAAYMKEDKVRIFEQMSLAQISQFGSNLSFKQGDTVSPWVSPLAVLACNKLSWKRMRSVKTGSIFAYRYYEQGWVRD